MKRSETIPTIRQVEAIRDELQKMRKDIFESEPLFGTVIQIGSDEPLILPAKATAQKITFEQYHVLYKEYEKAQSLMIHDMYDKELEMSGV